MVNFEENPELKEILNKFHHKDDSDGLNEKYERNVHFFNFLLFKKKKKYRKKH